MDVIANKSLPMIRLSLDMEVLKCLLKRADKRAVLPGKALSSHLFQTLLLFILLIQVLQ